MLPAEWEKQKKILLAFPHQYSDWKDKLSKIQETYKEIIQKIYPDKIELICENIENVKVYLEDIETSHVTFKEYRTNDTWVRDYGQVLDCDFTFNGWGGKYEADLDNLMTSTLYPKTTKVDLCIEGGAIEVDGEGTFLATSRSILDPKRNPVLTKGEIEDILASNLGIKKFLWLENGDLENDDTDSHIDMLARFVDSKTIVYVKCEDSDYIYYDSLKKMEEELKGFGYNLVPLPLPKFYDEDGERTPATYTNYLITNTKILIPAYSVEEDKEAFLTLQKLFSNKECIQIDSRVLIKQGGSIHCASMNIF
ncbi:MAG: agmatine deiminase family protein [Campylobacterales bacterium]|nr:agmatine deiminase family protein [Campylobacterales bacterium]